MSNKTSGLDVRNLRSSKDILQSDRRNKKSRQLDLRVEESSSSANGYHVMQRNDFEGLSNEEEASGDEYFEHVRDPIIPEKTDLIPFYEDSVAYQLLNHHDRGCLIVNQRQNSVKTWKITSRDAAVIVGLSGLAHLSDITYDSIDIALVSAFVERWHPETNTFHMPWGEMTVTLHDTELLLGLPCNGKPIMPICEEHTEGVELELANSLGLINLSVVKGHVGLLSNNCKWKRMREIAEDPRCPAKLKARIYLWWVVTQTLFVDKSTTHGHASIIEHLREPENAGEYAWAAGALAFLYRELGMASLKEAVSIGGCLTLLQAWIYMYFPRLRPRKWSLWREGDPCAAMFLPPTQESEWNDKLLSRYRRQLDNMTAKDVDWLPYGSDPGRRYSQSLFRGIIHYRNIYEAYMPDRVTRQFGYTQNVPRLPIQLCGVDKPSAPKKYVVVQGAILWLWTDSGVCRAFDKLELARCASDCTPDYMYWYKVRTFTKLWRSYESDSEEEEQEPEDDIIPFLSSNSQQVLQTIAECVASFHRSSYEATIQPQDDILMHIANLCENMMPHLKIKSSNRRR